MVRGRRNFLRKFLLPLPNLFTFFSKRPDPALVFVRIDDFVGHFGFGGMAGQHPAAGRTAVGCGRRLFLLRLAGHRRGRQRVINVPVNGQIVRDDAGIAQFDIRTEEGRQRERQSPLHGRAGPRRGGGLDENEPPSSQDKPS